MANGIIKKTISIVVGIPESASSSSSAKQIVEAAEFDTLYIWANYNAASYTPGGTSTEWMHLLFKTYSNSYAWFAAYQMRNGNLFLFNSAQNSWNKFSRSGTA